METLNFHYAAAKSFTGRAHVGAVGSGDLEILMEPSPDGQAHVRILTSVDGFGATWKAVLDKFFFAHPVSVFLQINDFGATPGVVSLRLAQAVEELER